MGTMRSSLILTAWTLTRVIMAIPHPLLDAPRQRVSAGYGCRMNTETDDGMIEHHFNIGMAYSSDDCNDALSHVGRAVQLNSWICRSDTAGMTWIEFRSSGDTCLGALMNAVNQSFPGMKWLETGECDSAGAPVPDHWDEHNSAGLPEPDTSQSENTSFEGPRPVAQKMLARDEPNLKDTQTECMVIPPTPEMQDTGYGDMGTVYYVLVHADVLWACHQVKDRLQKKGFVIDPDGVRGYDRGWDCYLVEEPQYTRLAFRAATNSSLDVNLSHEQAFGMQLNFDCYFVPGDELKDKMDEIEDTFKNHQRSVSVDDQPVAPRILGPMTMEAEDLLNPKISIPSH